jgi:hypothetical protein
MMMNALNNRLLRSDSASYSALLCSSMTAASIGIERALCRTGPLALGPVLRRATASFPTVQAMHKGSPLPSNLKVQYQVYDIVMCQSESESLSQTAQSFNSHHRG